MPYSWILLRKKEEDFVQVNQSFDVDEYYLPILFYSSEKGFNFFMVQLMVLMFDQRESFSPF